MPTKLPEARLDQAKYARGILAEEIKFRRDRRQQIFSWASSLLVAIIGGTTAVASTKYSLTQLQLVGLYIAILILGGFSSYWIYYHYDKERKFRANAKEYDVKLGLPPGLMTPKTTTGQTWQLL
jgi:hypothetical protein